MSINKVIERKAKKVNRSELRKSLVAEFIAFVEETQVGQLSATFPSVVIGCGSAGNILGVTYSPSRMAGFDRHIICSSTNNIALSSTRDQFHIGYGANSASGNKTIPFDLGTLTKAKKRRLFKQVVECLVSESYRVGYESTREHQVWKGFDKVYV